MPRGTDPTFYRSPAAAIAAPPEGLAYVAAFDPAGTRHDAMTVVDCDAGSPTYGKVIGWTELPSAGNERALKTRAQRLLPAAYRGRDGVSRIGGEGDGAAGGWWDSRGLEHILGGTPSPRT
jgi:hypothetical protein